METGLLRSFVAVAEAGSLSKAAIDLGYAQSSVSEQIRRLERELAAPLFSRTSTGVSLTSAGQRLLPEAARLLVAEARLRRSTASRTRLRLGAVDTLAARWLPDVLSPLPAEQRPTITMDRSDKLLAEQVAGRCDVVILYRPVGGRLPAVPGVERLQVEPLASDLLQIVVAPGEPPDAWVVTRPGCVHRELFDRHLAPRLDDLVIEAEGATPDALRRLAAQGVGRALLPSLAVTDDVAEGTLVVAEPPAGFRAEVEIVAVHARDAGPDVSRLVRRLRRGRSPRPDPTALEMALPPSSG